MKTFIQKIITWTKAHKKWSIVILIALIGVVYGTIQAFSNDSIQPRYVLSVVEKGNIITSISGTGQVSASNQINLKPKSGGDITSINVKAGQSIKAGTVVAYLNASDAQKAVRDAQVNLESAQIALEKLLKPADSSDALLAKNAVATAKESKAKSEQDIIESYDEGYNQVADAFLTLPTALSGIDDILGHSYLSDNTVRNISNTAYDYLQSAEKAYYSAKDKVQDTQKKYKSLSRQSDQKDIENLIEETYQTANTLADAIKAVNNLVDYVENDTEEQFRSADLIADQQDLDTYTKDVNAHILTLLSTRQALEDSKAAVKSADRTIQEKEASLAELESGTDTLDLRTAQLTVTQRQNTLQDAREDLADYTIRAPFDGVIGQVDVKKFDTVTSGDTVAVLLSKSKIAEISVNEIDVTKIKLGQKVTLTFDAVDGLTITGEVVEVDLIGTITSGVVNYNIKIGFDTEDERIKSSMSVTANIITDMKQDVLSVPVSAVKTENGTSYVEVAKVDASSNPAAQTTGITLAVPPIRVLVVTGISNDESIEIISGLEEGQQYVSRTITTSTTGTQSTQSAPSLFGGGAGARPTGGGGGNFPR